MECWHFQWTVWFWGRSLGPTSCRKSIVGNPASSPFGANCLLFCPILPQCVIRLLSVVPICEVPSLSYLATSLGSLEPSRSVSTSWASPVLLSLFFKLLSLFPELVPPLAPGSSSSPAQLC